MAGENGATPTVAMRQSTVIVSALRDGEVQGSNDLVLSHGPEANDGQLIAKALELVKKVGGILVDAGQGVVDYYPFDAFAWRFEVKRVTLAIGNNLAH